MALTQTKRKRNSPTGLTDGKKRPLTCRPSAASNYARTCRSGASNVGAKAYAACIGRMGAACPHNALLDFLELDIAGDGIENAGCEVVELVDHLGSEDALGRTSCHDAIALDAHHVIADLAR